MNQTRLSMSKLGISQAVYFDENTELFYDEMDEEEEEQFKIGLSVPTSIRGDNNITHVVGEKNNMILDSLYRNSFMDEEGEKGEGVLDITKMKNSKG